MSASVWRKVLIGNIFEMKVGGDLDLKSFSPYKESIYQFPIYSNGLEENGLYGYTSNPKFKKDSVTVTGRGTLGHAKYRNFDFDAIIRIIILEKKYEDINGYLISEIINFFKPFIFESTSIPQLTAPSVAKTRIYLPKDPEEQKHISDILSTCDTVIQNTQKTIDKYKAIKQGMMQDLFTRGLTKDGKLRPSYKEAPELYKESELGMIPKEWSETPVIEIGEVISGGTPSTKNTDFWDGNIPFVTPNDLSVNEGAYITSTERYITVLGLSKSSAIELPKGTLIISSRAPIGYLAIASFNCVTNQGCKSVVFDSKQDPLFHYYNFQRYVNKMKSLGSGTTFAEISKKDVEKLKVSYPLKDEQIEIAKRLSSIDSTIQKEESIFEKYKNIKTGLMARLLTPPDDAEIIDETGETL